MICEVNDQPVLAETVGYREIGFDEPVNVPLWPYRLSYGITEVCDLIAEDYRAWVQEMRADFEASKDPYPEYLHNLGFPSLDVLVQHEADFCRTIQKFLFWDLLRRSFPWSAAGRDVQWIMNSIDSVSCHDGAVEVVGQVFRKVG
jgi:hypothetical protein